jgi:hypothetical protein
MIITLMELGVSIYLLRITIISSSSEMKSENEMAD